MKIRLNGEWTEAPDRETLADLLARLGIDRRRVAVEWNREIVAKERYEAVRLGEGDSLEIVQFVGGG